MTSLLLTRSLITAVVVGASLVAAGAADARCTRLGFSVNDYGKEGPIKDAKELLDKYIAKWAAERGIKGYTVGKKDVTCELFLDFIVFDEHTCKAEATVCWPGDKMPEPVQAGAAPAPAAPAAPKAAKAAAAPTPAKAAPIQTGTVPAAVVSPVKPAPKQ